MPATPALWPETWLRMASITCGWIPSSAKRVATVEAQRADLKLEFHGTKVTSDGGLLVCRELDDTLGLSETAGEVLTDTRTGATGHHTLVGQFRQSVFGRLAGYEDINDADRLAHDPAMRWVVGGQAVTQN